MPDPSSTAGRWSACGASAGAVVTPATDALLAIDEAPLAVPTPCIRCGWCTDLCPARLNVAILNDDFELAQVDHSPPAGRAGVPELRGVFLRLPGAVAPGGADGPAEAGGRRGAAEAVR